MAEQYEIVGAVFIEDEPSAHHKNVLLYRECVFFKTRAAFNAWLETPDGKEWLERHRL